jgi:protein-S-isoprenylcysteine O-methyltransferase Ste14
MIESTSDNRGAAVRFPPPLVFLIGTLIGVLFRYAVAAAPVPLARPVSAIGGVLVLAVGVALIVSARNLHASTGQNPAPWKPSPVLILKGPYRFTRNPMYVGVTIVQIGLGVALNNLWISLFALPALLAVHLIAVLPEERYLTEKFGDAYTAYLAQVRRYL